MTAEKPAPDLIERLERIEERLSALEDRARHGDERCQAGEAAVPRAPARGVAEPGPSGAPAGPPPTRPGALATGSPPPPPPPMAAPAPSWSPEPGHDLEATIGRIWVSRAGLALVVLAIALFMKWAYDRNLISPTVRTALGILAGVALLTAGEVIHRHSRRLGGAFTGAGLAALYATFFAAYNLYHLFGQATSFLLMVLTTAAAVLFAVRYQAPVIAVMGIVGGFAVPYLLPGQSARLEPVLIYYLVLESGLLVTIRRLERFRRELLTTAVVAGLVAPAPAVAAAHVAPEAWFGYFLVVSLGVGLMAARGPWLPATLRPVLLTLATLPFLAPLALWRPDIHPALAAGYFLLIQGMVLVIDAGRRAGPEVAPLACALVFIALGMMTASGTGAWWTVAACALGSLLTVLTTARDRAAPVLAALLTAGPAGLFALIEAPDTGLILEALFPGFMLLLFLVPGLVRRRPGPIDLAPLLVSAGLFGGALWALLDEHDMGLWHGALVLALAAVYAGAAALAGRLRPDSPMIRLMLAGLGVVWLTLFFPAQFDRATVTLAWAVEAAVLVRVGCRIQERAVRLGGLAVLVLAGLHYLQMDTRLLEGAPATWAAFLNPRFAATLFLAASGLGIATAYHHWRPGRPHDDPGPQEARVGMAMGLLAANLVLLLGVTLEINLGFRPGGPGPAPDGPGPAGEQFALTAFYALHSIVLVAAGFWRASRALRLLGLLLFALTLAKTLLVDLRFLDTLYRILSFLALGILLVAASLLYQRFRHRLLPPEQVRD